MSGAGFGSVLVANRGEIARRVFRTCREMGIATVAVFSDPDADAAFVAEADRAVGLGGAAPAESYLRADAVLEAAACAGAEAVHPGYGFLSEHAEFARAVTEAGLVWIGPPPEAIAAMGSKIEAKRLMAAADVPLLPGAELDGLSDEEVAAAADQVGLPLLVKASAGGGGRGMRVVESSDGLADAVAAARREAEAAFGDGALFIERFVPSSRHVEVQIMGDDAGRVIHLHERDCSVQRRHQKVIEEAPAPALDESIRVGLHAAAVRAGEAIGYRSAGTVEFLLTPDGEFFFLEVNTRLQVEHPVTEAVLDLDLVRLQLDVAAGRRLPTQDEVPTPSGHAIEARLYAEDPAADFRPSTGRVYAFDVPDTVRVDAALLSTGGVVSQHYDPMIAKVVAHGDTREATARTLAAALRRTTIAGVTANLGLLTRTLEHAEFIDNQADTGFLERHDVSVLGRELLEGRDRDVALLALALGGQARRRARTEAQRGVSSGFRNVPTEPQRTRFALVGDPTGDAIDVTYRFAGSSLVDVSVEGADIDDARLWAARPDKVDLAIDGVRTSHALGWADSDVCWAAGPSGTLAAHLLPRFVEPDETVAPGSLVATMPGTIRAVPVSLGDRVESGDTVVVMEAMKMELALTAPGSGTITEIGVAVDDTVETGTLLAVISEG